MTTIYYGPVINPESLTAFQALPWCLIAVGPDGNIIWLEEDVISSELDAALEQHDLFQGDYILVELKSGEFIMPGFIDTHIVRIPFPHHCHNPQLMFDTACVSNTQSRGVCMTVFSRDRTSS